MANDGLVALIVSSSSRSDLACSWDQPVPTHRETIEFDTVDITADRVEERVEAAIMFEQVGRAAVNIVGVDRFEAFVEAP